MSRPKHFIVILYINDRFQNFGCRDDWPFFSIVHPRNSSIFVLTWTELGAGSGPLDSLIFHKLQRRWRLYFQKGNMRLKYIQGLEDIAIVPRQVFVEGSSN